MRRVADHLDIPRLKRHFRTFYNSVEARHVQVIWLLAQDHVKRGVEPTLRRAAW